MSFSQPASGGDKFVPAEHNGHLLLIYPKDYNPNEDTNKGVTQAAGVDVVVVDKLGPTGEPLVFRDARVFGNLARSVRHLTEPDGSPKKYLGRLGQGPNTQGTPPWIIQKWTDADVAAATPVAAAFEAGQFSPPVANPMAAQAPAPPATQQWQGQQPPAPSPQQWQAPAPAAPPAQQWQAPGAPAAAPPVQPQASQQQWQAPPQPSPQQWQQPPTAAPPVAPTPAPSPPASGVEPALAAFLQSRGIVTDGMTQEQALAIAPTLPQ